MKINLRTGKENKTGRPIANNVGYFSHVCKDVKELISIQHKHKTEIYEAFFRQQQCLKGTEVFRIDLKNTLEKKMFEWVSL